MDKGNLWGILKDFGGWRLSKWVSILTFPGFLAVVGFCYLRNAVWFSSDALNDGLMLSHIHSSMALFGYVLVPLFFVFILRYQGAISSVEMPLLRDRRWGYMGAVMGSLMVAIHVQWDAAERAGRQMRMIRGVLGQEQTNQLREALTLTRTPAEESAQLLSHELQRYAWVVFLALLLLYTMIFFGRKLSIHMSAVTAIVLSVGLSLYRLSSAVQRSHKAFGANLELMGLQGSSFLYGRFLPVGLAMLLIIYWARRKEKAHSHSELVGGMLLGGIVVGVLSVF